MATLRFKEFRCVFESDEIGDDSPYWLVFHGHPDTPAKARLEMIAKQSWDNDISSGDSRFAGQKVSAGADLRSVVILAFIEEDGDKDYIAKTFGFIETQLKELFSKLVKAGASDPADLREFMLKEMSRLVHANRVNDDIMDMRALPITTAKGSLPLLHMDHVDGTLYRVRFDMM